MIDEDESSFATVIQRDPAVYVSSAMRTSSNPIFEGCKYWETLLFSDDDRIGWFMATSALTRRRAQRIHDNVARCVRRHLARKV